MLQTEGRVENAYLGEVLAEQAQVEQELKRSPMPQNWGPHSSVDLPAVRAPAGPLQSTARAIDYRITGFWFWKTVIVPPHVYVVHTRRGHAEPITLGMGLSFRYNPQTDAFLLLPASLQTIAINAKCITSERQGVLVQAYVQWIIDDLAIAYRRLDFSDQEDPMRIVNVQLREQAEAVLKDKVATMSIDQVLTDKLPIIEELTQRLRLMAEGTDTGSDASGLGLKIVTVQIKEAVVSSARLWENLQKPFRAEREKVARLAELEAQQDVAARELARRQACQTAELEGERQLAERRAAIDRERYDRDQAEATRRHRLEQEAEQRSIAERNQTELARKTAALELALKDLELEARRLEQEIEAVRRQVQLDEAKREQDRARLAGELLRDEERSRAETTRGEREVALLRSRRSVENDLSEGHLRSRLIEHLAEIAQAMPQPKELKSVTINGDSGSGVGSLMGFLAGALDLAEGALKRHGPGSNGSAKESI